MKTEIELDGLTDIPTATRDEGDAATPGPDHDGPSLVESDIPLFAGPEAVNEGDLATTPDQAPEPPADLVEDVVDDEHSALTRRLHQLQADHGSLIERVAKGLADAGEIARSRGRIREAKDAIEDNLQLQAHLQQVKAARAARTKVQRYHLTVDATEAALAQAALTAARIDEALEVLGTAVGELRASLPACDALNHAALVTGGRPLLDQVNVWSSQRAGLDAALLARLLALRVLTNRAVAPASQEQTIAVAVRSWASPLIAVARARGPALVEDEAGGGDDA